MNGIVVIYCRIIWSIFDTEFPIDASNNAIMIHSDVIGWIFHGAAGFYSCYQLHYTIQRSCLMISIRNSFQHNLLEYNFMKILINQLS